MALGIEALLHKQLVLWTDNLSGGKVREQIDSEAIGSQQSAVSYSGDWKSNPMQPTLCVRSRDRASGKLAGRKGLIG
jgi:hypothetical protein